MSLSVMAMTSPSTLQLTRFHSTLSTFAISSNRSPFRAIFQASATSSKCFTPIYIETVLTQLLNGCLKVAKKSIILLLRGNTHCSAPNSLKSLTKSIPPHLLMTNFSSSCCLSVSLPSCSWVNWCSLTKLTSRIFEKSLCGCCSVLPIIMLSSTCLYTKQIALSKETVF
ncbi:hypothetical protein BT96DRAFT_1029415 [Gymnopus androsaceus JB14]|uniref:Uncharacterized protein n=1 Tax=Gymnopus androsaceus JB14 TaxID=1447944 RepID=A0A6A4ISC7_9AGAR|nr:hypothetical protein BT96DRAFT_1029415 [Gymnopus androsaceus JB14]